LHLTVVRAEKMCRGLHTCYLFLPRCGEEKKHM
jgi:hypothetical protein